MNNITHALHEHFDDIESSKEYNGYSYSLTHAVIILILGSFCGLTNMKLIHQWAFDKRTRAFLHEHFGVIEIPCYSWFTQILSFIDPVKFNERFTSWVLCLISGNLSGKTISLDGKTIRSTANMKKYDKPLHIISAQIGELGITLGQMPTDDKSNEIPAVREMIEMLNVNGCMIVADALHCQRETASVIVENGGDYLLSVKDNQSTLKAEIEDFVQDKVLRKTMDKACKTEKNGSRTEKRTAYACADVAWLHGREEWKSLACIGAIHTQFTTDKGTSDKWHYYISSRKLTACELLHHARMEWSVESMHWLLDVHFREDYCRVQDENVQEVLNIVRKIVLNHLRTYKQTQNIKKPYTGLMLDCMLNPGNIVKMLKLN